MSNYVNTGYQRGTTLTIDKQVGGVSISGYPREHSILSAFTYGVNSYAVITTTELARMATTTYNARLADFLSYVGSDENIADINAITTAENMPYRQNTTACPVGG